jgi:hypothetical protein
MKWSFQRLPIQDTVEVIRALGGLTFLDTYPSPRKQCLLARQFRICYRKAYGAKSK